MPVPAEVRPVIAPEVALLDAAYPERESRHQLRFRRQLAGEGTYFVAWSGEEPAGWVFLAFPEHASEWALCGAQLSDLQVAAPYRGAGLGRALLDASEQAACDAGCDTIGLSVTVSNPDNELARSIYLRRGYRDSGQGEYHDGYHYHDAAGIRRYHGEQHVYLVKRLSGADS
ncbi:MAG TPA: GNAT family N-acetyltransferase [Gaiellales bacterium]|jgi:GNAT superfamily N-acetyltransferase|nr:GNAT family N-acetyltransferase [Gaiellales bacterium]